MAALLRQCQPRHDLYTVFGHAIEAMAIAVANSVDLRQREIREQRYLAIVGRYDRAIVEMFPQIMAELVLALEAGPGDVLGALFHDLELHNKARGQFFTPYSISRMMADVTLGDPGSVKAIITEHGFVSAMEPACGAGSMVIALAEAMGKIGINYQRHLHVTAIDIDPRAVHMAYAQLSLLHVPAHLMVGNSLSNEIREHWYTPAHILGGWNARLAARKLVRAEDISAMPPARERVTSAAAIPPPPNPLPASSPAMPRQLSLF
ncbi:N-6 DNA methylase [Novosphingobium sp. H3SJ31-1]|uniref:site-specific DNA-methyltransferase (adenine-specific) n=2 Tax=Novosphingobium album (ex Liu et al. 2023) TaxID=3031130 RepID=A0ABT5WQ46_9SPHN|nr:N-6 DNA methylase [Novosphingobium album (ex Liu et al. 2023)]